MEFFEHSVFFGVSLSLLAYGLGVVLQKRFRLALFNPLLLSVIVTILVLVTAHIDYEVYYAGAKYLSYLLTPATVCLAVPLYEKSSPSSGRTTRPSLPVFLRVLSPRCAACWR